MVDELSTGTQPSLVVILCHGYGAPADDLAPIGAELLQTDPVIGQRVRFYFPAAPLDLTPLGLPGGRAWWPIDMQRMVMAAQLGRWNELRAHVPEGMKEAREKLTAFVEAVQVETGLPYSRIVLGGFSQGAMISTDLALRLPEPVAALCLASGALVAEPEWIELAAKQKPLQVLQSHGRQDPILPFFGAEALRDLLTANGHGVHFLPFDGGHTIPWSMLEGVAGLIKSLASGEPT